MAASGFWKFLLRGQKALDVSIHRHDYYEVYFFLRVISLSDRENVISSSTEISGLIPPGLLPPPIQGRRSPLSENCAVAVAGILSETHADAAGHLLLLRVQRLISCHHFSSDFSSAQILFQQTDRDHRGAPTGSRLPRPHAGLLHYFPAVVHQPYCLSAPAARRQRETALPLLNICEYINAHLEEDLSLDALAGNFM